MPSEFKEKYGVGALEYAGRSKDCPHHWVNLESTFSMEHFGLGVYTRFFCVGCGKFTAIDLERGQSTPQMGKWKKEEPK